MLFEGKDLNQITIEDIQFLIENQITENISIEYKSQCWERNDKGTRELLRDISAMANASGGHIILGVEENNEIPTNIKGIPNAETETHRIINLCRTCISDKIIGLNAVPIPTKSNDHVIVIRIPRSTRVPHMVTFKNLYQCWRRHGTQKAVMSIDEIRDACIKVENLRQNLESFIEERKDKAISQSNGKPIYLISATPMIVKDEIVDIFDPGIRELMKRPPKLRILGQGADLDCTDRFGEAGKPTLYGIKAEIKDYKSIEVLRNGHIEFMAFEILYPKEFKTDDKLYSVLYDFSVVEYLINFMLFLKEFMNRCQIFEPFVISVCFFNIYQIGLFREGTPLHMHTALMPGEWNEKHLIIPPMQISSIEKADLTARIFCDRIWNAFGFEKAIHFDAKGNTTIKDKR